MSIWELPIRPIKVTCPVLVISGGLDRITPAKFVKKVADKYNADYEEFKDHAHWVIGEPKWDEVAQYASDWLDKSVK